MGFKKFSKMLVFVGAAAALAVSLVNDKQNKNEENSKEEIDKNY